MVCWEKRQPLVHTSLGGEGHTGTHWVRSQFCFFNLLLILLDISIHFLMLSSVIYLLLYLSFIYISLLFYWILITLVYMKLEKPAVVAVHTPLGSEGCSSTLSQVTFLFLFVSFLFYLVLFTIYVVSFYVLFYFLIYLFLILFYICYFVLF